MTDASESRTHGTKASWSTIWAYLAFLVALIIAGWTFVILGAVFDTKEIIEAKDIKDGYCVFDPEHEPGGS